MDHSHSKLETTRQSGKTQVDARRTAILDTAEKLFLQNGLENTRIIDIAAEAGISKMSLYRYFPNRDVIALEIHAHMLEKISALVDPGDLTLSLEKAREVAVQMIRSFFKITGGLPLHGHVRPPVPGYPRRIRAF
jgi:AcrR family transcriptional regulator